MTAHFFISKYLLQLCKLNLHLGKHHKIIIPEPLHKDVFISVKLHDSPSSTTANLSDLSALVIVPAWRRSNAWCACKSRHDVTHCEVGIYCIMHTPSGWGCASSNTGYFSLQLSHGTFCRMRREEKRHLIAVKLTDTQAQGKYIKYELMR